MDDKLAPLTARIVIAYAQNNSVNRHELSKIIMDTYGALRKSSGADASAPPPPVKLSPAVPIKESITSDFIICLEDGLKFKTLKRHLWAAYGLTPNDYRKKWGLPSDYPMSAPNYAAKRATLAKQMGLGSVFGKKAASSTLRGTSRKRPDRASWRASV